MTRVTRDLDEEDAWQHTPRRATRRRYVHVGTGSRRSSQQEQHS
ncbi:MULTISPECIES: hypothetical protein [unclassified Isoptericola]